MPIDAFLFDLDGTLVDSIPDLTKAINLLRSELDLSTVTSDQVRSYVGDGVGLLLQRALPEEMYNMTRRKRFMEIYTEHLTDETVIYPGILTFLELHHGKPMAVVTNKPQHLADILVDRLGLAPFFQSVIGAELSYQRKPHPDMVHRALDLLGSKAEHTVLLGDHHVDLRAAHAAGVKSCFCSWGLGHNDNLQADFQANTTSDLLRLFPEAAQS